MAFTPEEIARDIKKFGGDAAKATKRLNKQARTKAADIKASKTGIPKSQNKAPRNRGVRSTVTSNQGPVKPVSGIGKGGEALRRSRTVAGRGGVTPASQVSGTPAGRTVIDRSGQKPPKSGIIEKTKRGIQRVRGGQGTTDLKKVGGTGPKAGPNLGINRVRTPGAAGFEGKIESTVKNVKQPVTEAAKAGTEKVKQTVTKTADKAKGLGTKIKEGATAAKNKILTSSKNTSNVGPQQPKSRFGSLFNRGGGGEKVAKTSKALGGIRGLAAGAAAGDAIIGGLQRSSDTPIRDDAVGIEALGGDAANNPKTDFALKFGSSFLANTGDAAIDRLQQAGNFVADKTGINQLRTERTRQRQPQTEAATTPGAGVVDPVQGSNRPSIRDVGQTELDANGIDNQNDPRAFQKAGAPRGAGFVANDTTGRVQAIDAQGQSRRGLRSEERRSAPVSVSRGNGLASILRNNAELSGIAAGNARDDEQQQSDRDFSLDSAQLDLDTRVANDEANAQNIENIEAAQRIIQGPNGAALAANAVINNPGGALALQGMATLNQEITDSSNDVLNLLRPGGRGLHKALSGEAGPSGLRTDSIRFEDGNIVDALTGEPLNTDGALSEGSLQIIRALKAQQEQGQ